MEKGKGMWLTLACVFTLLGVYIALGMNHGKAGKMQQTFPVFADVSNWLDDQLESWFTHEGSAE